MNSHCSGNDVVYVTGGTTKLPDGRICAIPDGWYRRDPADPKQLIGPLSLTEALLFNPQARP
jgi:hypothetical protein